MDLNKEIATLETNAVEMQKTIDNLQDKIDNDSNIDNSENVATELKLGTYQITEHI